MFLFYNSKKVSITKEIIKYTEELVQDLYGNYVVQFVLQMPSLKEFSKVIAKQLSNNIT
jgi:hypothetical protein